MLSPYRVSMKKHVDRFRKKILVRNSSAPSSSILAIIREVRLPADVMVGFRLFVALIILGVQIDVGRSN